MFAGGGWLVSVVAVVFVVVASGVRLPTFVGPGFGFARLFLLGCKVGWKPKTVRPFAHPSAVALWMLGFLKDWK